MTVVCVGARFLTVIKELYFAYRSFFSLWIVQPALIVPGSFVVWN